MHDPHFSFPSEQLFMVLSAMELGKKVVEMVSLDWHYRQGKTVLWESLDKETWSENVWMVSGIEAVCSAWPKLAWLFSTQRTAWGSRKDPGELSVSSNGSELGGNFMIETYCGGKENQCLSWIKQELQGKKTKTQWLGACLQGGQNAFKKDQSFCTLLKSMMKVPSEKIALFKLTKQSQAITDLTTKKTFGIKLSK